MQVVQVLQVSYNEALTLKDTKRLTLSLLLLFTPFPSRPCIHSPPFPPVPIAPDSYRDGIYRDPPKGKSFFKWKLLLNLFIKYRVPRTAYRYVITML